MKIILYLYILVLLCIIDVQLWESWSKSPVIYPTRYDLVVDAHYELTLGCRGSELLNWTFHDQHNKPRKDLFTIKHSINENDLNYKYEAILIVNGMKYTDVGFYYCHGEKVPYNTPVRSSSIYIYVKDDTKLSVLPDKNEEYIISPDEHIPCRGTSPDVNIELWCEWESFANITASSYQYCGLYSPQYEILNKRNVLFHPYYGFITETFWYCTCQFTSRMSFRREVIRIIRATYEDYMFSVNLEGPNEVNINDNVSLMCTIRHPFIQFIHLEKYYVGREDVKYMNDSSITVKKQIVSLKRGYIIRSELIITNVSARHMGIYTCRRSHFQDILKSREIFLQVYDKRNFSRGTRILEGAEPIWINLGETISLTCEGPNRMVWLEDNYFWGWIRKIPSENFYDNKTRLYKAHFSDKIYSFLRFICCDYDITKCISKYEFIADEFNDWYNVLPHQYIYIPCISNPSKYNVSLGMDRHTSQASLRLLKYDEQKGFLIQIPDLPHGSSYTGSCIFGGSIKNTVNFYFDVLSDDYRIAPLISPYLSVVPMNEKLELLCKMLVYHNVSNDMLQWDSPQEVKYDRIINTTSFNTLPYKVITSTLTMHNVGMDHEGIYKCYIPKSDLVAAQEYISVIDPFKVKPLLKILEFRFAYIGQKMKLKCSVDIPHNVIYNISWNIQNEIQSGFNSQYITKMSYTNEIKHVYAKSVLEINNVTYGHAGNYTCIVNDYFNRKRYATEHVLVRVGKRAKIRTCNYDNNSIIEVKRYKGLILKCSVDGDPKPNLIWKQNSSSFKLKSPLKLSGDNTELTIILALEGSQGLYSCIAHNLFGEDHWQVTVEVLGPIDYFNNTSLTFIVICTILLVILYILLCRSICRDKKHKLDLLNYDILDINLPDFDTKWEIPNSKIKLGQTLGSGYFGFVMKSSLIDFYEDDPAKTVAVKMVHPYCGLSEINSLISEMQVLANIGNHINLIKFLGACTENVQKKQLQIVMEYCPNGNLGDYLLAKRDNFINLLNSDGSLLTSLEDTTFSFDDETDAERVSTLELICWALQVAQGMQFLAARKVVHGDLAARNVLLAQNNIVKISDFGLARILGTESYYKKKSQCPLPIKWMAIESIREKIFSTKSDVWSFGVFLWELFSLARTPYPDLQMDFGFYHKILDGYRLERPDYSPLEIYNLMSECWQFEPSLRPTFECLADALASLLPSHVRQVYMPYHEHQNIARELFLSDSTKQQENIPQSVSIAVEDLPVSKWIPTQQVTTQV